MTYTAAVEKVREYAGIGTGNISTLQAQNVLLTEARRLHGELAMKAPHILHVDASLITWPSGQTETTLSAPTTGPLAYFSVAWRYSGSTLENEWVPMAPSKVVEADCRLVDDALKQGTYFYHFTGYKFSVRPTPNEELQIRTRVIYPWIAPATGSDPLLARTTDAAGTLRDYSAKIAEYDIIAVVRTAIAIRAMAGSVPDYLTGLLASYEKSLMPWTETQVQAVPRIPMQQGR